MKKVIIAGGREFSDFNKVDDIVTDLLLEFHEETAEYQGQEDVEIVCGEARGADALGKRWAELYGVTVVSFPANWDEHGRSAGPIRNAEMADYGNTLVAFWDGKSKGTKNMIDNALRKGLEVHVYRY